MRLMLSRRSSCALVSGACLAACAASACLWQQNLSAAPLPAPQAAAPAEQTDAAIAAIREEGLERSHVMETLDYMCNVIGPRLTASPNAQRANEWSRDQFSKWGLTANIEPWAPFGQAWILKSFSLQVTSPQFILLTGYPKAWAPGFDVPLEAPVIHMNVEKQADLDKYRGELKGAIVLLGAPRPVPARFEQLATRQDDARLQALANLEPGGTLARGGRGARGGTGAATQGAAAGAGGARGTAATGPGGRGGSAAVLTQRAFAMAAEEGAALVIDASTIGDGGTYFVTSATVPAPATRNLVTATPTTRPWAADAPKIPAQITLGVEDYNRLCRMIAQGQQIRIRADIQAQFKKDVTVYNTVAEIPGSDLKDQVVMAGAHLDSWQAGTGATDNGAGSACVMEAARILRTLNLKPRRTIRFALWTGEEQGLMGSRAYVKEHFGYMKDAPRPETQPAAAFNDDPAATPATAPASRPAGTLVKGPDYEKLSLYLNIDNGTGKIRGISTQGNTKAVPFFKQWIKPFADLDAKTVSMGNMASTDHVAFDAVGLPAFNFIQDPIEYSTRTHHSNADVYDRIQADDMKQASTIMAAFLWQAANIDERFPRKTPPGAAQP